MEENRILKYDNTSCVYRTLARKKKVKRGGNFEIKAYLRF